jgi:capsular polysaccharide biosynthesis protein
LELVGVRDDQMLPWAGTPVTGTRVLILQHDGRRGGGRPLSLLRQMQRRLHDANPPRPPSGRLFISRRDAKASRQWVANQEAVEAVFASRGFDVVSMKGCPLVEQVRHFRGARIVAGISGAGLSDLVFSAPGTHVIVLHSESHMQWYAAESRARSHWKHREQVRAGELAMLGDSPRFYAHLAAALSQYCHAFLSGDEMPISELTAFLDAVLQQVLEP